MHFAAVLLFIFVGAVIREINLLTLLAGAMIGLLVLQWRFNSRTLVGLQLKRRMPQHVELGKTANIELTITNPKYLLGSWLVVAEDGLQKLEPDSKRLPEKGVAIFDEIRPRGSATRNYHLAFHERGRFRIGPSVISTRFPLGLGRGWRTLDNPHELIVRPRIGEFSARINSLFQQKRQGQAAVSPKVGMHEADFYGLRPWQSGDSRRWIHWRTTARLGEICVRQFERQQQQQICILLDLFCGNPHDLKQREHAEQAISFLATLALRNAKQGADKLAAAVAANRVVAITNLQSAVMVDQLLDGLATLNPHEAPDLDMALDALLFPLMYNPVLLVVSTRGSQMKIIRSAMRNPVRQKILAKLKVNWLNISAGELAPYFTMHSNAAIEPSLDATPTKNH